MVSGNFCQGGGGGGVQARLPENIFENVSFCPQPILLFFLQRVSNNYNFPRFQRGPTFPGGGGGGGPTFSRGGGSKC